MSKTKQYKPYRPNEEELELRRQAQVKKDRRIIEITMSSAEMDRRWDEIRHRIDVKKEPLIINISDFGVKYVSFPATKIEDE